MQVMPKGSTEASSVIISSRVRTSLSYMVVVVSDCGLGTNRECTDVQLSTMWTNIARLSTFNDLRCGRQSRMRGTYANIHYQDRELPGTHPARSKIRNRIILLKSQSINPKCMRYGRQSSFVNQGINRSRLFATTSSHEGSVPTLLKRHDSATEPKAGN